MKQAKNIPVLILAGGLGTRISEETYARPKPMVEIGDIPILVHIMRWYYSFGFDDFVICAGYRSWEIKQYFLNYNFKKKHLQIDHRHDQTEPPSAFGEIGEQESWRVRVLETGQSSATGARVFTALQTIAKTDTFEHFAVTYGDGVGDVDLDAELAFHRKHGKIGTVLGVRPMARFGELELAAGGRVNCFKEKPQSDQGHINGGFFLFRREMMGYLERNPEAALERQPLSRLAEDGELMMFDHDGFWQPMDTLRDKTHLQSLWDSGRAPWLPTRG